MAVTGFVLIASDWLDCMELISCARRVHVIGIGGMWLGNRMGYYWEFGLDGVVLVVVHWLTV